MIFKIIYQASAYEDIREILAYVFEATGSKSFSEKYVKNITDRIKLLSVCPRAGYPVGDFQLDSDTLKCIILKDYRVYYELGDGIVEIVHIWHSKKLPPSFT